MPYFIYNLNLYDSFKTEFLAYSLSFLKGGDNVNVDNFLGLDLDALQHFEINGQAIERLHSISLTVPWKFKQPSPWKIMGTVFGARKDVLFIDFLTRDNKS